MPCGRCIINRRPSLRLLISSGLLIALTLAACSGSESAAPSTRVPTRIPPTPTPRSTALPEVPTAVPFGAGARQIELHWAVVGAEPNQDAQQAAAELTRRLDQALDLAIPVKFETETAAYESLCSGAPHAAWVSAFTYAAAAQDCGAVPVLAVVRGRRPLQTIGSTAEIGARVEIESLDQLATMTFCRSEAHDLFTAWIFPGLLMAARGVDPLLDLGAVRDFPDDESLMAALAKGECAAAAFPAGTFAGLRADLSDAEARDAVHLLVSSGETEAPAGEDWAGYGAATVPYEVLVFPPDRTIPAALRADIADAVLAFFADRTSGADRLDALLDATGVMPVEAAHFADFVATVEAAHWQVIDSD